MSFRGEVGAFHYHMHHVQSQAHDNNCKAPGHLKTAKFLFNIQQQTQRTTNMIRRKVRKRREYLFRKAVEQKASVVNDRKMKLKARWER